MQAGFATGTLLILAIGGLCLYTAFRVLDSTRLAGGCTRDARLPDNLLTQSVLYEKS